ncbi:MAG: hypothetical protein COW03_12910 [Cytophagales bacterium CG12_big_fil_rev_8_21_14_0_65_40_12]|nr:MAG: hypothetical protein COW03_12910 [Cytophagales bacterium CG12_big_fil_rev_8_21_14_0_65_40_12]
MKIKITFLSLIISWASIYAQEKLTIEDAVQLGLEYNLAIKISKKNGRDKRGEFRIELWGFASDF